MTSRLEAAQARAAGMRACGDRPRERRGDVLGAPSAVRARVTVRIDRAQSVRAADGAEVVRFVGYASVTDTPYRMWDSFGEYDETVVRTAFGPTLAADPLVEFVPNHGRGGQIPMAHTRNGTLRLVEDDEGLRVEADLDPRRSDVADLLLAIERGDLAEMSFRFVIVRGRWSDDFSEYFIHEVDLERGDVSPVNFGANPFTHIDEISARALPVADEARDEPSADPVSLGGDLPAEPTPTTPEEVTPVTAPVELAAEVVEPNSSEEALRARVADLEERLTIRHAAEEAARMTTSTAPAYDEVARVGAESRTYNPDSDPRGGMFLRDFAAGHMGDYEARDRLMRHAREERIERAATQKRDVGTGAFAGLTIPQYLVDMVAPLARARRPLADNCTKMTLPADGMTVTISRVTTGTSAAIQATEAAGVSETDIDDTALTVNVRTIAGQQDVSFQALARSVGAEQVILRDLVGAYHTALDSQIINADGNSGTHLGIRSTSGISTATLTDSSPTPAEAFGALYAIQSTIESALFMNPDFLVMAPRRWHWFRSAIGTDVTLVGQGTAYPPQSLGKSNNVGYGAGVRGDLAGLPVIVDGNIPLTVNTDQDVILAVNSDELFLWEQEGSPIYMRAAQPGAGNLMEKMVVYGYSAFTAGRYPAAHGVISGTGLAAPTVFGKAIS